MIFMCQALSNHHAMYEPGLPDERLLLGLKGTISEMELHTIRGRLTAVLLEAAQQGKLALQRGGDGARDPGRHRPSPPDGATARRHVCILPDRGLARHARRLPASAGTGPGYDIHTIDLRR